MPDVHQIFCSDQTSATDEKRILELCNTCNRPEDSTLIKDLVLITLVILLDPL